MKFISNKQFSLAQKTANLLSTKDLLEAVMSMQLPENKIYTYF